VLLSSLDRTRDPVRQKLFPRKRSRIVVVTSRLHSATTQVGDLSDMASLEKSRNSLQTGVGIKPLFVLRCDRTPVMLT
jgi:hypothetical protein